MPVRLQHSCKGLQPQWGQSPQAEKQGAAKGAVGWLPICRQGARSAWGCSRGLPASPRETLAVFSAVLNDDVWAVNLDVNTGAVCAAIQMEEGLSPFFPIRDSNASGKPSTGQLGLTEGH